MVEVTKGTIDSVLQYRNIVNYYTSIFYTSSLLNLTIDVPLFNPRTVKSTISLGMPFVWPIEPMAIVEQQYIESLSNGSQER